MATIEKRGNTYRIRVSGGYTADGKQVRSSFTWTPPEGMSEKKARKEAELEAARLESMVRGDAFMDGRIKFEEFSKIYLRDSKLKAKTKQNYTDNLVRINAAIGHIPLNKLTPTHINMFYNNLAEEGIRDNVAAVCKKDILAYMEEHNLSKTAFAKASGISRPTLNVAIDKKRISKECAEGIAAAMGLPLTKAFRLEKDMAPLSPATLAAYHRTLSAVLGKAVKWGYITSNPAEKAEKPAQGSGEASYLDEAEARRLLELLQNEPIKWRAPVSFDLLSGLRRAEFLGLRWCDVDVDACLIHIGQTWNYLPGVGCYVATPKSDDSERPIKVTRTAILMLLEYKRWQDERRELMGDAWENPDDRIFTTDTGSPIFPDSITQWFTKFRKKHGFPDGITIHSLRHTYASLMIADGTPLIIVSRQLGHAKPSTTNNIYAHVIKSAEAKALEVFDRFNDVVLQKESEEATEKITKKAAGD